MRSLVAISLALLGLVPWAKRANACSGEGRGSYPYPIVLRGSPQLSAVRIANLSAHSRRGKEWRRIPLQVDEVNARGDYVLAEGLPFTRGTDDGLFDYNDELVLWGGDLGEDFEAKDVPEGIVSKARYLWRVTFCRGETAVGSVLLSEMTEPLSKVEQAHVVFHPESRSVSTELYEYRFAADHPALLGEVKLKRDGTATPIIASSSFLMPLATPWYLPDLWFRRDDFESQVESWQTGPLRTIVAVGVKYESFLSLFRLHLFSELVFYRNKFEIPSVVEFAFDPSRYLKPGSGIAYSLRYPDGGTWQVSSNLSPLPPGGPVVEDEERDDVQTVFHAKGKSEIGAFRLEVRADPSVLARVPPPRLIEREDFHDEELGRAWPWLAEIPGDLGVYIDFAGVEKGVYDFGLDLLLSAKANETFTDYGSLDSVWRDLTPKRQP